MITDNQFKHEVKELTEKFYRVIEICEKIETTSNFDHKISKIIDTGTPCNKNILFKPYMMLSNKVVSYLRSLYNSIYFENVHIECCR